MKYYVTLLFVPIILLSLFLEITNAQSEPVRVDKNTILLEDFQEDEVGKFPIGWYDRDGNKQLLEHDYETIKDYNYRIAEEEGNKYLHYQGISAKHINFPLINREEENIYDINIYDTPILSWKVRAHKLPENANEDSGERNDAVASVYVVFDFGRVALFKKVPKTIRYSWSTTLEEGTELSKLFGNQKIVVVESGHDKTGKWVTFKRNIVEDYRRLFGDNPPKTPLAILILSDGDSTGNYVEADYDDFYLKAEN